MAIAFDAASANEEYAATHTLAHTCSGSDRYLLAFAFYQASSDHVTGVTYDGVAMSNLGTIGVGDGSIVNVYGLANPASGTHNIVYSTTGAGARMLHAASWVGVDQSASVNDTAGGLGQGSPRTDAITVSSGGTGVGFIGTTANLTDPFVSGQTLADSYTTGNTFESAIAYGLDATEMSWTWASGTRSVGSVAVALNAAAGGSPPAGTVTIGTITHDHDSASVPWTYDAADETGYEYSLNSGAWTAAGTSPLALSGLTPSTAYSVQIRAINASGNGTASTAGTWTTDAAPPATATGDLAATETTADTAAATGEVYGLIEVPYPLDNGTNTPLANLTDLTVFVQNPSTGVLVVKLTGQTTDADAYVEDLKHASIMPSTSYRLIFRDEDGVEGENEGLDTLTST